MRCILQIDDQKFDVDIDRPTMRVEEIQASDNNWMTGKIEWTPIIISNFRNLWQNEKEVYIYFNDISEKWTLHNAYMSDNKITFKGCSYDKDTHKLRRELEG